MKERPQYDFPVRAFAEGQDYVGAVRDAYKGMYGITLNRVVTLTLIPTVSQRRPWPPGLPDDFDSITDVETARRSVLALAEFAIVPDDSRAGSTESQPRERGHGTIFYVSTDEFTELTRDAEALSDEHPAVYDSVPISKLGNRAIGRLVNERVLPSGKLTERQLHMLGRNSKTPE